MTISATRPPRNRIRNVNKDSYCALFPCPIQGRGQRLHSGFTLLELLVVIMIIGLMANFIVLSYPEPSPVAQAKKETRKLAHLISLAAEDSLLRSRPVALHVTADGYRFLIRTEKNVWIPSRDKLFGSQKFPPGVKLELNLTDDETDFTSPDQENAQILLSSSGELTPFRIRLVADKSSHYTELTGEFSGRLKIRSH